MRAEKGGGGGGSKGSGFFNLFDWNRKSRKKLFSISPEGSKIARRIEDPLPSTRLRMMDEEDTIGAGIASMKGSSDYSCASSMTEEDLINGSKPAGVVARLMGLDSLPTSTIPEPLYSTPFHSFREPPHLSRNETSNINNSTYAKKMPSSPIERFQMEAIPSSRSAKSLPVSYHHKLLSPIKNPNFTYGRNASQIMEAAAKILEPRIGDETNNNNRREKVCSVGTSRVDPFRVSDPLRPERAASRLLQLSRVPVQNRYERGNGREEDIVIFRPNSPDVYEVNNHSNLSNNSNNNNNNTNYGSDGKGNKGKSVSLAVQAKVNVQKREGVNLSNRNNGSVHHKETGTNQSNGTNQRTGTNKQQKKANSSNTNSNSSILRQNNQKQNCIGNRAKNGTAKSTLGQQGRKSGTGESSCSAKHQKNLISRLSKPRRESFEISNSNESEKDSSSFNQNKDFPQKKRLIERNNNNINNTKKNNVLVDEYTKWNKETKDTTDVVSFTFTSPLLKQTGGSSLGAEKLGLVPVKGNKDALSLLFENKLRQLTAKNTENSLDFGKSELKGKEIDKNNLGFQFEFDEREKVTEGIFDFSASDQAVRVLEKGECSKKNNMFVEEIKQLSPFSVFGEESCSTSESSSNSIDGSKVSPSSVQAQNTASSKLIFSSETVLDTSSKLFEFMSPGIIESKKGNPELDYVTDVISNTDLEKMGLEGTQLESPLFDKLERKRSRTELERNESSLSLSDRKLVFDCIKESLDSKIEMQFRAGYEEWNKGIFARKKGIFNEIYREIEGWRKMSDLNVDEIVEKDMVTKMEYKVDSVEIGEDLEAEILDSLIDELVADVRVRA